METPCLSALNGRPIYHATPLHYLPSIFCAGALLSQTIVGYNRGRRSARRRDRILAVDRYVHFSLKPITPLLMDKLEKGYPHAILKIRTTDSTFSSFSLLPCNTKSWRSKWQCQQVSDPVDMAALLRKHDETGRFRSLEVLIQEQLPLRFLESILVPTFTEVELVRRLCRNYPAFSGTTVDLMSSCCEQSYSYPNLSQIAEYYQACEQQRQCPDPPILPFD
jgi:hypothetical protein